MLNFILFTLVEFLVSCIVFFPRLLLRFRAGFHLIKNSPFFFAYPEPLFSLPI